MLDKEVLSTNPIDQFSQWFVQAENHHMLSEANAMTVATISSEHKPSARIVLLKHYDYDGFVFYTNYNSRKGQDIAINNNVALLFWWQPLHKQIRIEGHVEKVLARTSDQYFGSRPRGSQIGAIVSPQSEVIPNREFLDERYNILMQEYSERAIPRPAHWGGYRVKPVYFEFWSGCENRLHDRFCYRLQGQEWLVERLAP